MNYTWTSDDYTALVSASQAVGIDPAEVAKLFLEESGLNPNQAGPAGSNVGGLNQMLAGNVPGVSLSEWLGMTAAEQIPYIFTWWQQQLAGQPFPSQAGTLLALNFLPGQFKSVGADTNPNAVLAGSAGPYASYYADNSSLDPSKTGSITPATCEQRLTNVAAVSSVWPGFLSNLESYAPPSSGAAPSSIWSTLALAAAVGLAIGGAAHVANETYRIVPHARRRLVA